MDIIYFGGSAAAGIIGWVTIFATIIWPKMKQQPKVQQLKTLTAIHFFRYFAITVFIAGLVSRKLPSGFADPAAFGDLIAEYLADRMAVLAAAAGNRLYVPVRLLSDKYDIPHPYTPAPGVYTDALLAAYDTTAETATRVAARNWWVSR